MLGFGLICVVLARFLKWHDSINVSCNILCSAVGLRTQIGNELFRAAIRNRMMTDTDTVSRFRFGEESDSTSTSRSTLYKLNYTNAWPFAFVFSTITCYLIRIPRTRNEFELYAQKNYLNVIRDLPIRWIFMRDEKASFLLVHFWFARDKSGLLNGMSLILIWVTVFSVSHCTTASERFTTYKHFSHIVTNYSGFAARHDSTDLCQARQVK